MVGPDGGYGQSGYNIGRRSRFLRFVCSDKSSYSVSVLIDIYIREDVKYYFVDFVRRGGEGEYPPNP